MSDASFLFYDLETFGQKPGQSRIAQFAAIRTDEDLNEIDEPVSFFVQPADDLLPSPIATLITHIAPQRALAEGVNEAAAFARIFDEMARPQTCTLGWNTLRFDDEFVRYGLFRNFHEPYEREWRGGNSRWDLLDVARLFHALRPDGLTWPQRDDRKGTSFKLEHLAAANAVRIGDAHEALSDVRATLGIGKLMKQAQPKLWDYALRLRDKRFAAGLFDLNALAPVLHVSQMFAIERLCAAPVLPLAWHPRNQNNVIVFDLDGDIDALLELDAAQIAERLYAKSETLAERGLQRVPLKEVHLNKCPALVAWNHLRDGDFERLRIDAEAIEAKAAKLRPHAPMLAEKMRQVFSGERENTTADADASLYAGFLGDGDKRKLADVRATPPELLGAREFGFRDARLDELLFRYRARNFPQTLNAAERVRWNGYRRQRLLGDEGLSELTLPQFFAQLDALRSQHADAADKLVLLDQLESWGKALQESF